MSVPDADAPRGSRYWVVPLARAVVAAAAAITITFSADHSAPLGFLAFGLFAALSGIAVAVLSALRMPRGVERSVFVAQGAAGVIIGAVAIVARGGGVPLLLLLISAWAAITGFLELYSGVRARRSTGPTARDWIFVGAVTAVLAVVMLVIPADFGQSFVGPDGVTRELTASVISVGVFGAYAAVVAVFLVIASLSLRWGTQATLAPAIDGGR